MEALVLLEAWSLLPYCSVGPVATHHALNAFCIDSHPATLPQPRTTHQCGRLCCRRNTGKGNCNDPTTLFVATKQLLTVLRAYAFENSCRGCDWSRCLACLDDIIVVRVWPGITYYSCGTLSAVRVRVTFVLGVLQSSYAYCRTTRNYYSSRCLKRSLARNLRLTASCLAHWLPLLSGRGASVISRSWMQRRHTSFYTVMLHLPIARSLSPLVLTIER